MFMDVKLDIRERKLEYSHLKVSRTWMNHIRLLLIAQLWKRDELKLNPQGRNDIYQEQQSNISLAVDIADDAGEFDHVIYISYCVGDNF